MKVILGIKGCSKCKMLSVEHPDVKYIELAESEVLAVGKAAGVAELPIVITTGADIKL